MASIKPTILFLNHNQENFGTYFRAYFLADQLSHQGYKIIMLCASGKTFDLKIRKTNINDNFLLITLPRIKYHQFFTGQILLRLPATLFLLATLRYDLCHAFTVSQIQIALPAIIAKHLFHKPLIIDWDDFWGQGFAQEHNFIIKQVLTFSEKFFLRFADKITYVSQCIYRQIKKLNLAIPAYRIYNGANIANIPVLSKNSSIAKLGLDPKLIYLVSMGNTYTTGLKIMLQAVNLCFSRNPHLRLIFIGKGQIPPDYLNLISPKNRNKLIIKTQFLPFEQIPLYLSSATCLLLPMISNAIDKSRFPIRLGDYLASGRPVVSNAVGEVKIILSKYEVGLTSPPNNFHLLAKNILKIVNQPQLYQKLSHNARKLAETTLSWEHIAKTLADQVYS